MMPIWKQLLRGLDDLMDEEIFLGCPAELDDKDPINHPPPVPTDGYPPQLRPTRVKGSVKASPAPSTRPLDHRQTNLIMLSVCLECSLCTYLLQSHSDYDFTFAMIALSDFCPGLEFLYKFTLGAPEKREASDSKYCELRMSQKTRLSQ